MKIIKILTKFITQQTHKEYNVKQIGKGYDNFKERDCMGRRLHKTHQKRDTKSRNRKWLINMLRAMGVTYIQSNELMCQEDLNGRKYMLKCNVEYLKTLDQREEVNG